MYRWINPEKGRYYHAHLDNDLFGGWTLVLAWGGLRNRRGNMQVNAVSSYEDGLKRLQAIDRRRGRRGYCLVGTHPVAGKTLRDRNRSRRHAAPRGRSAHTGPAAPPRAVVRWLGARHGSDHPAPLALAAGYTPDLRLGSDTVPLSKARSSSPTTPESPQAG